MCKLHGLAVLAPFRLLAGGPLILDWSICCSDLLLRLLRLPADEERLERFDALEDLEDLEALEDLELLRLFVLMPLKSLV